MSNDKIEIYSFYRFIEIKDKKSLKLKLDSFIANLSIKGTILIADEGINASISGNKADLKYILDYIKRVLKIRKIFLKINLINNHPFNKIKVRLKKEIVSLGIDKLSVDQKKVKYIHPKHWDNFINNNDIVCIDTRNLYEITIGNFKNSINPKTKSFREFPENFKNLKLKKEQKIAMYCTGGIRCEKASTFLKSKGFKNVYQLKGGILGYLSYNEKSSKKNNWQGECFVFDQRVTVNKKLNKGKFLQCYGCRRPISYQDTLSKNYKKGVCCTYCYDERTAEQKQRSSDRQKQIDANIIF